MTEPNEPVTPLSRMRFSWQRGTAPGQEAAEDTPEAGAAQHRRADTDGPAPAQPAPAQPASPGPPPYPPPPATPTHASPAGRAPATRLGRAADEDDRSLSNGPPPVSSSAVDPDTDIELRLDERLDRDSRRRPRRERGRKPDRSDSATGSASSAPEAGGDRRGRTSSGFDVPKPGGRFSGGRGAHAGVRVALLLTVCLVTLGMVGYTAYGLGVATMQTDTYALDDADVERYRLSDFPLEQAGGFAADYLRLCLTLTAEDAGRPGGDGEDGADADGEDAERRQQQLTQFTSEGVDGCAPIGEGRQDVIDASWTGASEPIQGVGPEGHARMFEVRVLTDQASRILAVPVYVADLRSGEGMRIVGDIGEMPQPILAQPDETDPVGVVDRELSQALVDGQFFQQYLEAWGSSERAALGRFVTPDASTRATAGLNGVLSEPQVTRAEVFLPAGVETEEDEHEWTVQDRAEAWVWVTWTNPLVGDEVTERRAYRLQLVMQNEGADPAQSWAVHDIGGGVPHAATD